MAFIVTGSETKNYTPAPEGTHQAVCVDIIDKGMLPNKFRDGALQHKVEVVWQINEPRDDGKRFAVSKRYTASLNDKATLRHDLESWRGCPFSPSELSGFDLESIVGANCLLNIVHKAGTQDPTKTFANVAAVMPLLKGMPKLAMLDYERPVPVAPAPPTPEPEPETEWVPEPMEDPVPF